MDAVKILKAARKKVLLSWGQGVRGVDRPFNTCCSAEAIEEVSSGGDPERIRAFRSLCYAAGVESSLPEWNDSPETTHAMVIAAFNLAIATLRL